MVAKRKLQQSEPEPYLRVFVAGKPVSVNGMYSAGHGRNKYAGRHLTNDAVAWEQSVWSAVWTHMARRKLPGGTTLHLPLRIDVELYRIRSNADPDNFLKTTCDGLKDALRVDDRFYSSVTARRAEGVAKTQARGALITVWEASCT